MPQRMTTQRLKDEFGIEVTAVFVPFSQSRNAKENHPSLNWKVSVSRNGREIITTDYMAGSGHCPSYKQTIGRTPYEQKATIAAECEKGKAHEWDYSRQSALEVRPAAPIMPDAADVVYSLVMDGDAIDYPNFEDWALNMGSDPDSRSAEASYRQCLEIGLKLRSALGEEKLRQLREEYQDF